MIIYNLTIEKSGDIFFISSRQFPLIKGYGMTESEASVDFFSKIHKELNLIIQTGKAFPKSLEHKEVTKFKKGEGTFKFPLTIELTMYLHMLMIKKNINRAALARLLALTNQDISSAEWRLEEILKISPIALPKYKKVQRLLDVKHDSSITEISEAFRVLDCIIDVNILKKNSFSIEPIVKI